MYLVQVIKHSKLEILARRVNRLLEYNDKTRVFPFKDILIKSRKNLYKKL